MLNKPIEQYWNELTEEIHKSGVNKAILSSEEFSSIANKELIQKIKHFTEKKFNTTVIVYLRRIDEYVESVYKQMVKFYGTRYKLAFDANAKYATDRLDCYSALKNWADIFGHENIKVRVFEKGQIQHNPVYDLLKTVGYSGTLLDPQKTNLQENSTLTIKYTEILRKINNECDLSKDVHERVVSLFEALSGAEPEKFSYLTAEERVEMIQRALPHDKRIAKDFLHRKIDGLYQATTIEKEFWLKNHETQRNESHLLSSLSNGMQPLIISEDLINRGKKYDDSQFVNSTITGWCTACGKSSKFLFKKNLRDSGNCVNCGASNRKRQIAYILKHQFGIPIIGNELRILDDLVIYNTESSGALHNLLQKNTNYVSSEYLGHSLVPGQVVNDLRHEDLQNLSFSNNSLDVVISSDVFEHIPDPYEAHAEIYRCLRPGGMHVFTVLFDMQAYQDDIRSVFENGEIKHLKDPIYHDDPITKTKKILVYRVFSLEMLSKLDSLGFEVKGLRLHSVSFALLGNNGLVFVAKK